MAAQIDDRYDAALNVDRSNDRFDAGSGVIVTIPMIRAICSTGRRKSAVRLENDYQHPVLSRVLSFLHNAKSTIRTAHGWAPVVQQ
jgi:hypothetical protein